MIADRHRTLEIKVLCRVQISRLFHSFIHFYAGFPEVLTEKEDFTMHNVHISFIVQVHETLGSKI